MKNDILISEVDMNNEVEQILKDSEAFGKKFVKYKKRDKEIINSLIRKGQIESFIDSSLFNNFNDSWNYFIKGICQFELAVKITQFINKFHDANNRAFTEKLDEIKSFIKATESLSLEAAFSYGKTFVKNDFEYVRLTNNYYQNKYNTHSKSSNYVLYGCGHGHLFNSNAAEVYATNVLFKEWLESKSSAFDLKKENKKAEISYTLKGRHQDSIKALYKFLIDNNILDDSVEYADFNQNLNSKNTKHKLIWTCFNYELHTLVTEMKHMFVGLDISSFELSESHHNKRGVIKNLSVAKTQSKGISAKQELIRTYFQKKNT